MALLYIISSPDIPFAVKYWVLCLILILVSRNRFLCWWSGRCWWESHLVACYIVIYIRVRSILFCERPKRGRIHSATSKCGDFWLEMCHCPGFQISRGKERPPLMTASWNRIPRCNLSRSLEGGWDVETFQFHTSRLLHAFMFPTS